MIKKYVNGKLKDYTEEDFEQIRHDSEIADREIEAEFLALTYAERVEYLIRERYTVSDEIAILRQREDKPTEFAEYNAFAEECKRIAAGGET